MSEACLRARTERYFYDTLASRNDETPELPAAQQCQVLLKNGRRGSKGPYICEPL